MEPVRVCFQFNRTEYVWAIRYYLRKSGATPLWDIPAFAAILVLLGFISYYTGITPMVIVLFVLLVVVAITSGIVFLFMPGYQFDHTPQLAEMRSLCFTLEDIGVQNKTEAGVIKWTYTKFWCSKTVYYLIQNRQAYTILPKRIFSDDKEQYRFEQIVMAANPKIIRSRATAFKNNYAEYQIGC